MIFKWKKGKIVAGRLTISPSIGSFSIPIRFLYLANHYYSSVLRGIYDNYKRAKDYIVSLVPTVESQGVWALHVMQGTVRPKPKRGNTTNLNISFCNEKELATWHM